MNENENATPNENEGAEVNTANANAPVENTVEQEAGVGGAATDQNVGADGEENKDSAATDTSDEVKEEGQTIDLEVPADVIPHAKYRVIGTINITDGSGQVQGTYPIGSVHAFSVEQGEIYVEQGLAEEVVEE